MASVRAKFDTGREAVFGNITSSFTRIGTAFDASYKLVYVQNFTDVVLDFSISYEGLTTCFSLAAGGTLAADVSANGGGTVFQTAVGESAWVKHRGAAPTTGFVQFSAVLGV